MNLPFDTYGFMRDTILIMFSWFMLAISFFSWGRFLSNILNIKKNDKKGIIANIWLGFVFCIFFFSIYHLFLPINAFASSLFYFPGIIYFVIKYAKKLPKFIASIGILNLTVIVLTLFMASAVSMQVPTNFDAGLYHLNSIKWINEYHIIKGIGNLHTRLGFNQSFFLYSASLNFHPFLSDYAFHASTSFLYALFFVGMILNGTFIDLLLTCLFFFIPMPYHWLSSPTPDLASTLIQIVIFRYFIEAVYFKPEKKERIGYISFAAILSALLITIKLSNVVYAIGLGIVTIIFGKKYNLDSLEKKQIGRAFIFIGIFLVLWITRGYIQTGYPFFPSTMGGINTKWTVPKQLANYEYNVIYSTSRSYNTIHDINSPLLQNYNWLPFWFKNNFFNEDIYWSDDYYENIEIIITLLLAPSTVYNWGIGSITLLFISLILIIVYFTKLSNDKNIFYRSRFLVYLLLIEIISLIFWFLSAPSPRFANGIFIITFITSLLLLKTAYSSLSVKRRIKTILLFLSLFMFIWNFNIGYQNQEFVVSCITPTPYPPMLEKTTDYGLKVFIPQGKNCQGWSIIPSTPSFNKYLSLIGSTLDSGFCIKLK